MKKSLHSVVVLLIFVLIQVNLQVSAQYEVPLVRLFSDAQCSSPLYKVNNVNLSYTLWEDNTLAGDWVRNSMSTELLQCSNRPQDYLAPISRGKFQCFVYSDDEKALMAFYAAEFIPSSTSASGDLCSMSVGNVSIYSVNVKITDGRNSGNEILTGCFPGIYTSIVDGSNSTTSFYSRILCRSDGFSTFMISFTFLVGLTLSTVLLIYV